MLNHLFIAWISVCARNAIKIQTKDVNKNGLVCSIFGFDLLTSRTQKIARWPPVFKRNFHIFSYNEQLYEIYEIWSFIHKFLWYHTFLK